MYMKRVRGAERTRAGLDNNCSDRMPVLRTAFVISNIHRYEYTHNNWKKTTTERLTRIYFGNSARQHESV